MTAAEQRVYKGISQRARRALQRTEGLDVEFKEKPSGLGAEDLVAFANSPLGGVVLLGVRESEGHGSAAHVVGCTVDDRARQAVLSRAAGCIPPVHVDVLVENSAKTPFLRIEVPSGRHKPYCTSGGTYKIRGDGRNEALSPKLLLAVFMEEESHQFFARFQKATTALESRMQELSDDLTYQLAEIDEATGRFRASVESDLHDVGRFAEIAQYESEMASSAAQEIKDAVEGIFQDVNDYGSDIEARLDALLLHEAIPDPVVANRERLIVLQLYQGIQRNGRTLDVSMQWLAEQHPAATREQLQRIRMLVEGMQADIITGFDDPTEGDGGIRPGKAKKRKTDEP